MEKRQCKICKKNFISSHWNERICKDKRCKWEANRRRQEKYKKSEKGKLAYLRWLKNPKRKELLYQYWQTHKEDFRKRAREWFKRHYPEFKDNKKFKERKRRNWLRYKEKYYMKMRLKT